MSSEIGNDKKSARKAKERAYNHLFKYLNPHTTLPSSKKTFSPVKMSKVKTSKGAVWEGFRAWHVCKTQHARSQMTEVSVEVTCHKIMTNHGVYQELDIGMIYWNNAHSLLFSISPQPPRSLQATSCNLLSSLSLSLEQAIQNGVFDFLPTWQKLGKNCKKLAYQFIVGTPLLYGWWG